jgi:hypothetical protein
MQTATRVYAFSGLHADSYPCVCLHGLHADSYPCVCLQWFACRQLPMCMPSWFACRQLPVCMPSWFACRQLPMCSVERSIGSGCDLSEVLLGICQEGLGKTWRCQWIQSVSRLKFELGTSTVNLEFYRYTILLSMGDQCIEVWLDGCFRHCDLSQFLLNH